MAQKLDFLTQAEAGADHLAEQVVERVAEDPSHKYDELLAYMNPMRRYPVLRKADDFQAIYNQYIQGTDPQLQLLARDFIIYGNIRLVLSVAIRLAGKGLSLLDMMQEGVIGMMTALEKFDPNHEIKAKFSTYATWWIRQAITRAIIDFNEKRPYRIPVHYYEKLIQVTRAIEECFWDKHQWPSTYEIYQRIQSRTDIQPESKPTLNEVVKLHRLTIEGYISLDDDHVYSKNGGDDGDRLPFSECIGDPLQQTEAVVEARKLLTQCQPVLKRIEEALQQLGAREAMIIRLRLGLDAFEQLTLEEIGLRYEVSRERIHQIEEAALNKIEQITGIPGDEIGQLIGITEELAQIASSV